MAKNDLLLTDTKVHGSIYFADTVYFRFTESGVGGLLCDCRLATTMVIVFLLRILEQCHGYIDRLIYKRRVVLVWY